MPLKRSYATEAEVPTEHKALYAPKDGRYVLEVEGFDNVESVLSKNTQLLSQHNTDKGEITRLTGEVSRLSTELSTAQAGALQRGQRAVSIADAELVDAVKAHGAPEEVKAKLAEYPTLKTKVGAQERRAHLEAIRQAEGWGEGAVAVLELIADLPEVELRDSSEKDEKGQPKKKAVAKVKGEGNVVTEKPFGEYFAERHVALLPSVKADGQQQGGTRVHGSSSTGGSPGQDVFERARSTERERQKTQAQAAGVPLIDRFRGRTVPGQQQQQ